MRAFAGRVQGVDFKWVFDNSVDDGASEVNQKLKDALVAYKGSDGEVMEYPTSSESRHSGLDSESSSSSVDSISSSSVQNDGKSSSSLTSVSSSSWSGAIGSSDSNHSGLDFATFSSPSKVLFYDSQASRLVVGSRFVIRLDVVGVDGRRVDVSGLESQGKFRVLDLAHLRAGIYFARLTTDRGVRMMKFVKN